ncbi:hypothetical protein KSP40_PGU020293 [Platanthera guangdongensis]|uniref:Uncharacterized protein n=1 Tax=Platanthera guangdongensis TaxID=2320717 RepID=A0ABR2LE58_9ASPA
MVFPAKPFRFTHSHRSCRTSILCQLQEVEEQPAPLASLSDYSPPSHHFLAPPWGWRKHEDGSGIGVPAVLCFRSAVSLLPAGCRRSVLLLSILSFHFFNFH